MEKSAEDFVKLSLHDESSQPGVNSTVDVNENIDAAFMEIALKKANVNYIY